MSRPLRDTLDAALITGDDSTPPVLRERHDPRLEDQTPDAIPDERGQRASARDDERLQRLVTVLSCGPQTIDAVLAGLRARGEVTSRDRARRRLLQLRDKGVLTAERVRGRHGGLAHLFTLRAKA